MFIFKFKEFLFFLANFSFACTASNSALALDLIMILKCCGIVLVEREALLLTFFFFKKNLYGCTSGKNSKMLLKISFTCFLLQNLCTNHKHFLTFLLLIQLTF